MSFYMSMVKCQNIDYQSFAPHEIFLMIKSASNEAIADMAPRLSSVQYRYVQRALGDASKLEVMKAARRTATR